MNSAAETSRELRGAEAEREAKDTAAVGSFFGALVLLLLIVIVIGVDTAP